MWKCDIIQSTSSDKDTMKHQGAWETTDGSKGQTSHEVKLPGSYFAILLLTFFSHSSHETILVKVAITLCTLVYLRKCTVSIVIFRCLIASFNIVFRFNLIFTGYTPIFPNPYVNILSTHCLSFKFISVSLISPVYLFDTSSYTTILYHFI